MARPRDRPPAPAPRRLAFLTQIAHRAARTLPSPEEYPVLRRESNGMFMFDVIESACGTEVPEPLASGAAWTELCAASNDLTAWRNDIRSLAKESANDEPTNYVTVLRHAHGWSDAEAVAEVEKRILQRHEELEGAAADVRAQLADCPEELRAGLEHLTDVIAHIPGGHAAWLNTSARYQPA
ncbi:terpene synthase family protein [Saccharopolyspora mangrovi]|uniref:Terpene synthase family protein n=1 Tax=Saccharopolyspora mangrovi TaxID=3082379 RepID=A0ABU6AL27_9PSEU|nr:terpene synthase family protein [Saccharopolyspora sp. S2-29]MEB3372152.1 terpene synthase family protein [Saccharopolyspora sp. S2-29]